MIGQIAILAGSLLAVLAVAGLVRWMGLGQVRLVDEAEAQSLAEDMLSGFETREGFLSNDGAAAALVGRDGTIGLLKRHGAKFAARKLSPPINAEPGTGAISIDSGESSYGSVRLHLPEKDADKLLTMM